MRKPEYYFDIKGRDKSADAMNSVSSRLRDLETKADVARANLVKMGAALAGGVAALGAGISRGLNFADEITRQAQLANTSTREFQGLAFAARAYGFEQEKLADILKDTNDKIGDFMATGGGGAADFFENIAPKVGLTADAFRDLSGPEALGLYARSLDQAGLSQQQQIFYMEALASDATGLIPLYRDNAAALNDLTAEFEAFGGAIDAGLIQKGVDIRRRMNALFSGVGTAFNREMLEIARGLDAAFGVTTQGGLERVAGMISVVISQIDRAAVYAATAAVAFGTKWVTALVAARVATMGLVGGLVALRGAIIRTGIGVLIVAGGELVYQFGRMRNAGLGFADGLSLLSDVAAEVWGRMGLGLDWLLLKSKEKFAGIHLAFLEMISDMGEEWAAWGDKIAGVARYMGPVGVATAAAFSTLSDEVRGSSDAMSRLRDDAQVLGGAADTLGRMVTAPIDSIQALNDAMATASETTDEEFIPAADRFASSMDNIAGSAGGAAASIGESLKEAETVGSTAMTALMDSVKSAVTGILTEGQGLKAGLSSIFGAVGGSLLNFGLSSLMAGFAPTASAGVAPTPAPTIASAATGFYTSAAQFAKGGVVEGPTFFQNSGAQMGLMGEAGPEAILPLSRGPDGSLGVKSGGGSTASVVRLVVEVNDTGALTAYTKDVAKGVAVEVVQRATPKIVGQSVDRVAHANRASRSYLGAS